MFCVCVICTVLLYIYIIIIYYHTCTVGVAGGGGDQYLTSGFVSQRETCVRAQEETGFEPAYWIKAEHQQELARSADLQCVSKKKNNIYFHKMNPYSSDMLFIKGRFSGHI